MRSSFRRRGRSRSVTPPPGSSASTAAPGAYSSSSNLSPVASTGAASGAPSASDSAAAADGLVLMPPSSAVPNNSTGASTAAASATTMTAAVPSTVPTSSASSSPRPPSSSSVERRAAGRRSGVRRGRGQGGSSRGGGHGHSGRGTRNFGPPRAPPPPVRREKTRAELLAFAWSEGRAAAARTVLACVLRAAVALLAALAAMSGGEDGGESGGGESGVAQHNVTEDSATTGGTGEATAAFLGSGFTRELAAYLSVPAAALLAIVPSKVRTGASPGFAFACPLVLLRLRDRYGSLPSVPCRVGETVLGRMTVRELAVVVPVHFLGAIVGAFVSRVVLRWSAPASWAGAGDALSDAAVDPVIYSEGHAWLYDTAREIVVNALFAVALLAVPELLRLNRLPRSLTLLVVYPLYSVAVDASGTASAFGPDVVYALRCVTRHEEVPIGQSPHMLGPMLGGLLGGKILEWFFPEDEA